MNKYETVFILKPDLSEDERKAIFNQINDILIKHNGDVLSANVWLEKKKFHFPIKKYNEGLYYLVNFNMAALSIKDIRHAYKLNDNILRLLITRVE